MTTLAGAEELHLPRITPQHRSKRLRRHARYCTTKRGRKAPAQSRKGYRLKDPSIRRPWIRVFHPAVAKRLYVKDRSLVGERMFAGGVSRTQITLGKGYGALHALVLMGSWYYQSSFLYGAKVSNLNVISASMQYRD